MDASEEYADVAVFYDYVDDYREREDVPFYVQAAVESKGPVLELGCGTGRVLLPIARAGIEIVGLDSSPHMLAICRAKLQEESTSVRSRVVLHEADMRQFDIRQQFALAILPFRSFQHLTAIEDQIDCLKCIRSHLIPGGLIILDVFNPYLEALVAEDIGKEVADEPGFELPDGRRVVRHDRHAGRNLLFQTIDVELIYYVTHPSGRTERIVHAFVMRFFYRFEVEHLLARCGFAVQNVYADYDKSPYGSEYPGELIVLATSGN